MSKKLSLALVAALSGLYLFLPTAACAAPITYVYNQTSSTVPGFNVTGSIVLDTSIAGTLPVSNVGNPGPYDFGNLLSFNITLQGLNFSLSDFTAQNMFGFPIWTINSPFDVFFVDRFDNNDFLIAGGSIAYNSDGRTPCTTTGACKAEGVWAAVPVPEPFSLSLFGVGVLGAAAVRRHRRSVRA